MLRDKIIVAEGFHVKSPSFARCKEGDLPLLNFSNLTCMQPLNGNAFILRSGNFKTGEEFGNFTSPKTDVKN